MQDLMSVCDLMQCGLCQYSEWPCSSVFFAVRCANHKESIHFYIFSDSKTLFKFNTLMDS